MHIAIISVPFIYILLNVGEFGIVYKGYIMKGQRHSFEEYLAIKTLKGEMHMQDDSYQYIDLGGVVSINVSKSILLMLGYW